MELRRREELAGIEDEPEKWFAAADSFRLSPEDAELIRLAPDGEAIRIELPPDEPVIVE